MANWGAIASAASAGTGIIGPLLASRQGRKNRHWNEEMFRQERDENRINSNTEWARSLDFKSQMDAYRGAGINPYMVAGNSVSAPSASASNAQRPSGEGYKTPDLSPLQNAFSSIPTMMLLNSQKANIDADTALKNTANQQSEFNLSIDQKYKPLQSELGLQQTFSLIENTKQTNSNLQKSNELLSTQIKGGELQNLISTVNAKYADLQASLDIESKTIQNRSSRTHIDQMITQMAQMRAATDKIRSEIELNKQALETGKITQIQMVANINKILADTDLTRENIDTAPVQREAIERSNMSIFAPVHKAAQDAIKTKNNIKDAYKEYKRRYGSPWQVQYDNSHWPHR